MINWTEEELREMAAADAAIDAEGQIEVDMELSRQLDRQAQDDRLDHRHRRKLQWQRDYYAKHRERINAQNEASKLRRGYVRKVDPARNKARCADWYARNRERVLLEERQRIADDPEYRERRLAQHRESYQRNKDRWNATRRQRRANDPEYREKINAQKRAAYQKKKEGAANGSRTQGSQ